MFIHKSIVSATTSFGFSRLLDDRLLGAGRIVGQQDVLRLAMGRPATPASSPSTTPSSVLSVRRLFMFTSYSPAQWNVLPSRIFSPLRFTLWRSSSEIYFRGKSVPTTPTSFGAVKKLAATAAWLPEPPRRRGFFFFGVMIESSAVDPKTSKLIF